MIRTLVDAENVMRTGLMVVNIYQGLQDGDKYVFKDREVELELLPAFDAALQSFATVLVSLVRDFWSILDGMLTTTGDCERPTKEAPDVDFSDRNDSSSRVCQFNTMF